MKPARLSMFALLACVATVSAGQETQPGVGEAADMSPLDRRIALETASRDNRFVITPHKPNYILPLSYSRSLNQEPYENTLDGGIDETEIKFQISFKIPLGNELFDDNGFLALGYTQQSYWQAYNSSISSPFRETNYEPELMLTFTHDNRLLGFRHRLTTFGFVHQSNGRSAGLSRSWNRVYADFIFERGNLVVSLKPWYRIPESADDDDNPDIDEYLGHGEYGAAYIRGDDVFSIVLRNNFSANNRGALLIDWSFPVYRQKLQAYLQLFNGYGESLIDYDDNSTRVGVGLILSNWL